MLKLDQREAKLGTSINTRREKHGEENVPAKDISITTMIKRAELCSLMREKLAAESFFNETSKGFYEPLFAGKIGPLALQGKFDECNARIFVGIDLKEISLPNITLANLRIDPQTGGMTQLKFTIQYHPGDDDEVSQLDNWLDQQCKLEVEIGKLVEIPEKQPQLALGDLQDAPAEA